LERKNLTDLRQQHRKIIDIHSDDYLDRLWLLMKNNPNATSQSIKVDIICANIIFIIQDANQR
jgi:hypothetical protein